ncbi:MULTISPECIES: FimV/HubP family polar landmark protein [Pseudomonas]|uniref:FimV/HubP family polar landmark protein n=1 Tax=Pseudomonas nitroreducens TaxID=46680 RepID=UPI001E4DA691|nr:MULTISPECIES: FimV/HubP family polar landmark protein [Pseudomonas]MCE4071951.1 LysM peptidoglycan-binding domain-containing protein [Pseudomonas nitritireducens]MCE4080063.1 LysM peptidoglycan-binding domain-containing protein [Pseudomonas nitroreducens]
MVRLRKLVQAIAAASALTSGMAHALGLGDIHLRSALNQPLDAEIELVEVRDLSAAEVIPKLASPEDFNKAGVDRQYFLTGLKFTPIVKPNGKSVIRVTSDRPVQEPYLNFLVEVLWPNGRLLREYTVLLDPPLYSPQTAAAVPRAPMAVPAPVVRPSATAAPRPAAAPARSAAPAPAAASRRLEGNEYRTGKNDTLWDIAARARPDGSVSVQQTMLAIQDLNPDAFLGGNINRLKSGQVLRLPDAEQIKARTQPTAETEVKQQYTAWREGRSLPTGGTRQLDATPRANAGNAPAQAETKDSLRLLSGENGKAKGGDKGSKDGQAVADKLAVTKESLDSTRRENDELSSRMTDLQSQMDKLQKLIALKDAQLAKLQNELGNDKAAANGAAVVPAPAPGAEPPAQPATPPAPAVAEQPVAPAPAGDAGTPPAPAAEAQPQPAPTPAPVAPAPEAQKPKPAPAPVAAPVEQAQTSIVDEILANPIWLGAIAGSALLALLVLLMIISRRRAAKEQESLAAYAADDEPHLDDDLALAGSELDTLDVPQAAEVAAPAQAAPERVAAQTSDALGEADIYIAYGRFNQAAELLQGAIYDEPQRADLRLKLMEVYAEIGDREGFARQENELREIGGAEPQVEQLKSRYPGMVTLAAVGGGLAAAAAASDDGLDGFSLDDFTIDSPAAAAEPAAQPHGGLDDAFDLALDDLDLGEDKPAAPAAQQNDDLSFGSFDLDDDLSLGGSPAQAPSAKAEDDFAFDLDLPEESAAKVEAPSLADDLGDFSLDLDKDLEKDTHATLASAEDDFLLGLDDDTASLSGVSPEEFSLDIDSKAPLADDLPDDFDLSLADDEPAPAKADDSFAAQLDEVSAELDRLSSQNDEPQAPVAAPLAEDSFAASDLDLPGEGADDEDDFDFLSGADEAATKLDLARAYIDMGDTEGARDILDEVLTEGNDNQQQEARELLGRIA